MSNYEEDFKTPHEKKREEKGFCRKRAPYTAVLDLCTAEKRTESLLLIINEDIFSFTRPFRQQEIESLSRATRGFLATDYAILNHGQVTRTTPEPAPASSNYRTIRTEGRLSSQQIERASLPCTAGL
ncbi:hypothetical protein TNCV_3941071 [Trichonephila clavipes]|uniref:Uncharacterized protein n=1 Tax=Trichonephila clavipes TaxID=2585209 RepID=A0A8X6VVY6_TRICX|nr:hypothetical protein TNCV_3941071 [Trichonephila clavipes]